MSKHTAGPWKAQRYATSTHDRQVTIVGDSNGISSIVVADLANSYGKSKEIQDANAHLIAAAPDLLAAAEEMIAERSSGGCHEDVKWTLACDMLRDAVRRARGEE